MKRLILMLALLLCFTGCGQASSTPTTGTEADGGSTQQGEVISVSIGQLEPGDAVCIGSYDFNEGTLFFDVQAEGGDGLYYGVHKDDSITNDDGVLWVHASTESDAADGRSITLSREMNLEGSYYVYIGCSSQGTALTDIAGTITYSD